MSLFKKKITENLRISFGLEYTADHLEKVIGLLEQYLETSAELIKIINKKIEENQYIVSFNWKDENGKLNIDKGNSNILKIEISRCRNSLDMLRAKIKYDACLLVTEKFVIDSKLFIDVNQYISYLNILIKENKFEPFISSNEIKNGNDFFSNIEILQNKKIKIECSNEYMQYKKIRDTRPKKK